MLIGMGVMRVMVWNNSSTRWWMPGLFGALLLFALMTTSPATYAQPPETDAQGAQQNDQQAAPGPVNQRQALERVRARYPGNVISINEVRQGNRVRYRVRIDNEGNIFTVFVDQATGRVTRE